MSEVIQETVETQGSEDMHPDIQEELKTLPSFLWTLLIMPPHPWAATEKLNEFRQLKAANDEKKEKSIHEYYSQAA